MELARVLVVDASRLGREGLEVVLAAHVEQVITVTSAAEALRILERIPELSLVIAAVPPGHVDTDALLARIVRRPPPRPRLILVESQAGELEALRAAGLGADGYLAKPVLFRDILRVLRGAEPGARAEVAYRVRSQPVGLAVQRGGSVDRRSEGETLAWAIDDLSMTGAVHRDPAPARGRGRAAPRARAFGRRDRGAGARGARPGALLGARGRRGRPVRPLRRGPRGAPARLHRRAPSGRRGGARAAPLERGLGA